MLPRESVFVGKPRGGFPQRTHLLSKKKASNNSASPAAGGGDRGGGSNSPPPPSDPGFKVGENEILRKETLIWLFLVHKVLDFWVSGPTPPS